MTSLDQAKNVEFVLEKEHHLSNHVIAEEVWHMFTHNV